MPQTDKENNPHISKSPDPGEIQNWLISQISERLQVEPEDIDVREPFTSYGLSSQNAIEISGELEEWLGCQLSPTLLYEYPTIKAISQFLAHGANSLQEHAIIAEPKKSEVQEIAVIGIGCRFPGADGPAAFWQLLRNGVDAITEVPPQRWDIEFFYDPDPGKPGKMNTRWGGFLEQVDQFDPHFFGISPREAAQMDPQQRLLLEVSWEALEDAGQVPGRLQGSKTGIFIGISTNEYSRFQGSDPKLIDAYLGTGNALSIAANRLSYFFNFRGPSIAVDTACSSSLLAVHLACRSLISGESTLALAGGVNLMLSPEITINFSKAGFMAPDGRCKAFDARANGYVRGEGAGIVVLKPLSKALADNDPIYAVIRGSAANQDGRSNGLTAPNQQAQEEVLREAFDNAVVSPAQIQYIEAHGTGTALGDPIEAKALGKILANNRPPGNPCIIGSVKTNIGHLESAAGIAGLIKVALSLKHRLIPPILHFQEPNPYIPFEELQLRVQQQAGPWPEAPGPALAGVSAFGFGGTNVHVVLQEAPPVSIIHQQDKIASNGAYLLPLSAQSPEALRAMAKAYKDFLTGEHESALAPGQPPPGGSLDDICYTASMRRHHHDYRLSLVDHSREKLSLHLDEFLQGETRLPGLSSCKPLKRQQKVVFVFSGQGSQWPGMGRGLMDREPLFRETLRQCDREIQRQANWSLLEELAADQAHSRLHEIDVMQPVLFSIQVALAALWQSWGIKPDAVVGYSLGEIAAAHVSGALKLEDAVRVICSRSRLLKQIKGQGSLAVVELSLEKTQKALRGWDNRVSIAASSSPTITVLSGDPEPLQEFVNTLKNQGVFCVPREEDVAVHAHQLDPLCAGFLQTLEGLEHQPASIPIYSTVTGKTGDELAFDAAYWVRNLREPVLFSAAVQQMLADGYEIFLEVSPHPVLSSSVQEWMHFLRKKGTVLPSLRKKKDEHQVILDSLGTLYTLGFQVNWGKLYAQKGRCLGLPSYTWQRKRYWIDNARPGGKGTITFSPGRVPGSMLHPLLNQRLESPLDEILFESRISTDSLPFLQEHRVGGMVVFSVAAYLEMVLAAAKEVFGPGARILENTAIHEPLVLTEGEVQTLQLILAPGERGEFSFRVFSLAVNTGTGPPSSSWRLHAEGKVRHPNPDNTSFTGKVISPQEMTAQFTEEWSAKRYYHKLKENGPDYGANFQGIQKVWRKDGEALGRVSLPKSLVPNVEEYDIHPVLLEGCFQLFAAVLGRKEKRNAKGGIYLPFALESFRFFNRPHTRLWSHALLRQGDPREEETISGDFTLINETGEVAAEVRGMRFKRVSQEVLKRTTREPSSDWLYQLEWKPKAHVEPDQGQVHPQGSWLIFSDRNGLGTSLARLLEKHGESYVIVFPGESFEISEAGHFRINPTEPDDFHRLFCEYLGDGGPPCHGIVHLWSLDAAPPAETTAASLESDQAVSCGSVLHLCQALVASGRSKWPRLWLVTRGGQHVNPGSDHIALAQAPVWGLGHVLAIEHPQLRCLRVDIDPSGETNESQTLFKEIRAQDHDREDQVVFRRGVRYVPRLVFHNSNPNEPTAFQPEGTYLITGGLGGLGLTVAKWMVDLNARHLVLVGRSETSAAAQEILEDMKKKDVRVEVFRADVTREEQISSVLAEISQSMPPLKGIIHAAGTLDDGVLHLQEWERFAKVLAPKVEGAWNLHALTRDMPLDFFVLFSSVVSLLGANGQGNYAAANAFLDALAHYRRSQGLPALCINWGPWTEKGTAAALASHYKRRWKTMGIDTIPTEQGLHILGQVLRQNSAQVVILPVKWLEFMQQFTGSSACPPLLSHLVREVHSRVKTRQPSIQQTELLKRIKTAPPGKRRDLLHAHIKDQIIKVLQLDPSHPVDPKQGLFDMGMDSLMAIELKNRIETSLGFTLPSVLTFNYSNIDTLVEYLDSKVLSGESAEKADEITTRIDKITDPQSEPIAIIGLGCRFPGGANDPGAFWQLLHNGLDAISEVPPDRWDVDAFYDPNPDTPGKTYARWGGFLDQVDGFDARFFGISPREAVNMDPQQRILLEVNWEALENAGQVPKKLVDNRTGVFVGIGSSDYLRLQMNSGDITTIDTYSGTGTLACISSGRLSYILGLQGPNMALDTACSSSLVTIHLACQSLRSRECDMALAGGVSLILSPESIIYSSKIRALSRDGRCKTFDAAADGYVQGEGCGMVVLKRLSDAEADGDNILALIRGSAINHDGRSSGLTVPNGLAQQTVIREAMAKAGVEPMQVSYVEAHGTGTPLGDPIEVQALAAVLGEGRSKDQPLKIGSVKTNIGHLEAAAGIAAVIKVVLAMQHQEIPAHLHFKEPNHHIPWEEIPIAVQTERTPWPAVEGRRIAGVSSFGLSGTNAHLVLEQPPQPQPDHPHNKIPPDGPYLLPISAHSPEALQSIAKAYQDFLTRHHDSSPLSAKNKINQKFCGGPGGGFSKEPPGRRRQKKSNSLYNISYTASVRRFHHDYRLALVDHSREKFSQHLDAFFQGETRLPGLSSGCKPLKHRQKPVFVFSGQGSQWPGMGRELLDQEPVFRETLQQCDREIQRQANWSLLEELTADEAHSRLQEIDVLQPVLFSIQVALAALWQSWGIKPDAVVGYSLGEIAAAHVSGALNLEDAVRVICSRSRLLKQIKGQGSLVVVELSLEKTRQVLSGWDNRVSIAASSSPTITVLSGDPRALQEIVAALQNQGIFCVPREEDVAVHSPQLDPLCAQLVRTLEGLEHKAASIPFYSTVTGKTSEDLVFDAAYWVRNLREPVLFSAAIQQMLEDGHEIFLEISPHPILASSVQEWAHLLRKKSTALPSLRKKKSAREVILDSMGVLYTLGLEVNWGKLYPQKGRCLQLPPYPWQRKRYWIDTAKPGGKQAIAFSPGGTPHSKIPLGDWLYQVEWKPKTRVKPDQALGQSQPEKQGSWLILSDRAGLGVSLAKLLQEQGEDYVIVFPNDAYGISKQGHFSINPGEPEDFHRLFQEAYGNHQPPCKNVVHLWSLDAAPSEETTVNSLKTAQVLGSYSVLHLVLAIAAAGLSISPRLWLVTRGAQLVGSKPGPLAVAQSPLWGLGNVIAREHLELRCVRVDLDPFAEADDAGLLYEEIWRQTRDQDQEDQVGFRQGVRYVPRLVHNSPPPGLPGAAPVFNPDSTYLITGGLGGLGLKVAQWMAEQGARYLALMGRRGASTAAQEVLDTMDKAGVRAEVFQADVTREDQVAGMLAEISQSMPPLKGIIHAAGVVEDGVLINQKWERFATVMAPKVEGTWIMHTLTLDMELDFFVLFSSAASSLGSPGQGNYAAANAFLDVLAHHRRNQGRPALSINWGPWAEVGMAAVLGDRGRRQWNAVGIDLLEPKQALQVLKKMLQQECTQVTVLPVKWSEFMQQFTITGVYPPLLADLVHEAQIQVKTGQPSSQQTELLQRIKTSAPGERRELLFAHIKDQVIKVLQLDPSQPVELQQGLFDMGMDSLMAIELKNRIELSLGFSLPAVLTFNYSTIESLAEYLESKMLPPGSVEKPGEISTSSAEITHPKTEPIAIIGMSCRFPGNSKNPEAFWSVLRDGVDTITEVPADRWDADALYDPDPDTPGKMNTRWGAFLEDVDKFDASFFGISPREAVNMDPQQRILLEVTWEALENAGQIKNKRGTSQTGIFIGLANNDYLRLQSILNDLNCIDAYSGTGTAACITSGRLAHILGLQGPNLTLDTACSSSLVAVHLACQSLHNRECDLALAGGVNLILLPEVTIYFSQIHIMAGDGRCKTFDAAADGYGRGEGCGVVTLKRLSDAEADGDNILAVIRGSAINHDGHSTSLTAPNGLAQEAVIRKALDNAGVKPGQVSYVEAHGTGTSLGDPIEVQSLAAVMDKEQSKDQPLLLGSVKTNIGHLEAAAGVASLIKVVLAMKHNEIPPHLHLQNPNPHIKWDEIPIKVPTSPTPWPLKGGPRIAGVSSFGFSGTNAHVILEEAPQVPGIQPLEKLPSNRDHAYLLPISAHKAEVLSYLAKDYFEFLTAADPDPVITLEDICCTASLRRNHHNHRLALVGNTREELMNQLKAFLQGASSPGLYTGQKPQVHRRKLVFVFPGQGNQWTGMGLKLMDQEPVFRKTLEQCDQLLGQYTDWSILDVLQADDEKSRLQDTEILQPTLFALQTALASLWKSWGIIPDAVVGHSIGELAAAYIAGVLSLEEAIRVVYYRGKLMQKMTGLGKMAAVGLSREEVEQMLVEYKDRLSIAAFNSPISVVLSGEPAAVEEVNRLLQEKEIFSRVLKVNYAFHSPQMDSVRDELVRALAGLHPQPPSIPIFSTVIGKNSEELTFDALYWGRNTREPVLFSAAIQQLLEKEYNIFLELSPHPTLITSIQEGLNFLGKEGTVLPSLHREKDERAVLLGSLGRLYTLGNTPDWRKLYPSTSRFVQLPAYPWQRKRYWLETGETNMKLNPERTGDNRRKPQQPMDTLPGNVEDWFYKLQWQPAALSTGQQKPGVFQQPGGETWLIFTDKKGIGKALARQLIKQGEKCVLVFPGDSYKHTYKGKDREYFRIDPGRREDFQRLLDVTMGPGQPGCQGIIHLWGLDAAPARETTAAALETAQTLGCTSILYLVQELAAVALQAFPRLWLVTRGVQPLGESHGPLVVAASPTWGFGRVIALEHPELWGGLVDLDPAESKEKCSLHLVECIRNPGGEDQLAFRKGKCYTARLMRNREAAVQSHPSRWRPDGTYLITGGLGDLGLQVARWMVEQGARRLILMGRTPLPRRRQWNKIEKESRLARQITCIRELEAMGASVHLASVDVAEEKQLASFLKKFHNENWPPIRGVMHAAGLVQVKPLVTIDVEDLTALLRPKVLGGWLLHRLLKDAPLDFFVLFSSAASLVNPPMLSSYAAGNTFLDILAHHRLALGMPALSINWGGWSEVGMMARQLQDVGRDAMPRGMGTLTPKQGVEVLGRLLCQDSVQVGVMPFDWQEFFRSYRAASRLPLLSHMASETTPLSGEDREENGGLTLDAILQANAENRKTLLESYFRDQLAIILQLPADRVDVEQSILELGIDSLTSIEFQNQIKADFGVSIPVAAFLQGHSLAQLAEQMLTQLPLPGKEPTARDPEKAKQLLAKIDELSDEEVEQLLKEISTTEEENK